MSAFLFAVEPEQSKFVSRLCNLPDGYSESAIRELVGHYQNILGDDFVVFRSDERPEFLPSLSLGKSSEESVFKNLTASSQKMEPLVEPSIRRPERDSVA